MKRTLLAAGVAAGLGVVLGVGPTAGATPLLSEVLYDQAGSDDGHSFVELYGAPGTDLGGLSIEGVNGSGGAVGPVVSLSGLIPSDGIFVVADQLGDGTTFVPGADLLANFDFQNGPDSIVLRAGGVVLDALGYGVFGAGDVFAGEGAPAPDVPAGSSLARLFANVDTGDNAADFVELSTPTPGTAPVAVPEPGAAGLFALGLTGLAVQGRRLRAGLRGRRHPAPAGLRARPAPSHRA